MKKLLKFLLGLLLLLVIAGVVLLFSINPVLESLRPQLQSYLSEKMNRPVTFGKLSFQYVPKLAVTLSDVKLEESHGEGTTVKQLVLKTALGPLLHMQFEIEEFGIEGADLIVTRNPQGELLLGGMSLSKKSNAAPAPAPSEPKDSKLVFNLKNAWLKDVQLRWIDQAAKAPVDLLLSKLRADFTNISLTGFDKLELSAQVLAEQADNLVVSGAAKLLSGGNMDIGMKVKLSKLDLVEVQKLVAAYASLPPELALSDKLSLDLDFAVNNFAVEIKAGLQASDAGIVLGDTFNKPKGQTFELRTAGTLGLDKSLKLDTVEWKLGKLEVSTPMSVTAARMTAKLKTTGLSLEELSSFVPKLKEFNSKGTLSADLDVLRDQAAAQTGGLPQISGKAEITGLVVKDNSIDRLGLASSFVAAQRTGNIIVTANSGNVAGLPLGSTKLVADISMNEKQEFQRAVLQPSSVQVFGGELQLEGTLVKGQNATVDVQGTKLDIAKLIGFATKSEKSIATGTLDTVRVNLTGPANNFIEALSGSVVADASNGTIEGFNVLGQTLGKINSIPGLGAALLSFVPEKHQGLLKANSTAYDTLHIAARLNGKNIALSELNLLHSLYSITGTGQILGSGEMDLRTQLHLSETLTGGMLAKEAKLKLLLDKNQNMVIPVVITKKNGVFLVLPDVTNIGKRALESTAKDAATKALDKVAPGLGGAIDSLFR